MQSRRFPPPWSVEELDACFVVRDHDGQGLAYGMVRLSDAGFVTFLLAELGQELKQQPKGHDKPE
jgi:hypothetical protein